MSTIILYTIRSNFSGLQFLYVDVLLFVNFAFFFGKTEAYSGKLSEEPPASRLVSFIPLFSLTVHTVVMIIFEICVFCVLQKFYWFEPFNMTDEYVYESYENYSIFCISMFQYVIITIIFSQGKPYRNSIFTNKMFMLSLITFTLLSVYITVYPTGWIIEALELKMPPVYNWRFMILALAVANFVTCIIIESLIMNCMLHRKINTTWENLKIYKALEQQMRKNSSWPILRRDNPDQTHNMLACKGSNTRLAISSSLMRNSDNTGSRIGLMNPA